MPCHTHQRAARDPPARGSRQRIDVHGGSWPRSTCADPPQAKVGHTTPSTVSRSTSRRRSRSCPLQTG
eukprot:569915-Prymnesium_polylepis.1